MTDHPKPIARYYYECQERAMAPGIADGWPETIPAPHTKNGRLVRRDWADHEAALAAEREQYEARIAELERERDELKHDMEQAIDGRNAEARANEDLCAAIEALADSWKEEARYRRKVADEMKATERYIALNDAPMYEAHAADLLALLEKKP